MIRLEPLTHKPGDTPTLSNDKLAVESSAVQMVDQVASSVPSVGTSSSSVRGDAHFGQRAPMAAATPLSRDEQVCLSFSVSLSLPGPSASSSIWRKTCCWGQRRNKTSNNKKAAVTPMIPIIAPFAEGQVDPGSCVAIMGASGAGKTTLLNCLAGKTVGAGSAVGTKHDSKASMHIDGAPATTKALAELSGFVHQEDLFLSTLTPREHLEFVTALSVDFRDEPDVAVSVGEEQEQEEGGIIRPPPSNAAGGRRRQRSREEQKEARDAVVAATLADFGLEKCANALIGGVGAARMKGISGGERKRLSTASACVGRPPLLFLDEPTSGLDSHMAHEVVELLSGLAAKGHTIVASIHQPGSDTFALFSHLCLLVPGVQGARIAFFGLRADAPKFFSSVGLDIPNMYNPADFYIRCLAPGQKRSNTSPTSIALLCDAFDASRRLSSSSSSNGPNNSELPPTSPHTRVDKNNRRISTCRRHFFPSNRLQFEQLFLRARLSIKRDPVLTKARIAQSVVMALIGGSIYSYSANGNDDTNLVQNGMGSTFFMVFNQGVSGLLGVLQVFPLEVPLFVREVSAKRYSVHNYVATRMLAELPLQLFCPVIFGTIMYFVANIRPIREAADFGRFLLVLVSLVLTSNASVSMGYAIGALSRTPQVALVMGPGMLMPLALFGGLFLNSEDVPPYWLWLEPLSFIKYGYHSVSYFVWTDREISDQAAKGSGFEDGDAVLRYLSVDGDDWKANFGALAALFVGWRIVTYFFLVHRAALETGSGI